MSTVFFDLDKTLLAVNSATLLVRYELGQGNISLRQAASALGWLLRYRLGDVALDAPLRQSIWTLKGQQEQMFAERMQNFYNRYLRPLIRPGALAALKQHRENGDQLVLLSSTFSLLAHPIVKDLDLMGMVCTHLEVDKDGLFTGLPVEPLCFGEGKLQMAKRYCKNNNLNIEATTFYSDSNADAPVLDAVGLAVAINPDPLLRRHAKKKGWPIVDWGRPIKASRRKLRRNLP